MNTPGACSAARTDPVSFAPVVATPHSANHEMPEDRQAAKRHQATAIVDGGHPRSALTAAHAEATQWNARAIGPAVVTDLDPTKVRVFCRLNGRTNQDYPVSDIVMDIPHTVSLMSKIMTLEPGDALTMGTSSGSEQVKPGDTIEVEIPEIGVLRNTVVAG